MASEFKIEGSPFYWDDELMETNRPARISLDIVEAVSPFYWDDELMETAS